jgi:hypothetical protein
MPLLLHGARQVGKTYLLREFGKEHFRNTVLSSGSQSYTACNSMTHIAGRLILYLESSLA